jgi:hypothetical protein
VREAALGWLLDESPLVRKSAVAGIERAAAMGGVSGVMLRRIITIRNWLPEPDRGLLDGAIQACRRKGVEISPWPQPQVREVLASGIDGAGAQSIFVLARQARRSAMGGVLLRHDIGIRDAWVRRGLTRTELEDFLAPVQEIGFSPVSLDYVQLAAAHALALNPSSGVMPPFGMLDVMETAGLQGIQPKGRSADDVLGLLGERADPALSRAEVAADRLANSRGLPGEVGFLNSWFEADIEVRRLLGDQKLSRRKRIDLVQEELLPRRVGKWVERLAWTALTLQHGDEDQRWEAFFVSANELKAGRPIGEIPLMVHVAATTVDAYAARRPEGWSRSASRRQWRDNRAVA